MTEVQKTILIQSEKMQTKRIRNKIKNIILLTSTLEQGDIWGMDTCLGNVEDLITRALDILNEPDWKRK